MVFNQGALWGVRFICNIEVKLCKKLTLLKVFLLSLYVFILCKLGVCANGLFWEVLKLLPILSLCVVLACLGQCFFCVWLAEWSPYTCSFQERPKCCPLQGSFFHLQLMEDFFHSTFNSTLAVNLNKLFLVGHFFKIFKSVFWVLGQLQLQD